MGVKGISVFTGTIIGAKQIQDAGLYKKLKVHYEDPDFVESYGREEFDKRRAIELAVAAKLMNYMCEQGAEEKEFTSLVLYTYLVMDSVKYDINFARAANDLGIADLKAKYMSVE